MGKVRFILLLIPIISLVMSTIGKPIDDKTEEPAAATTEYPFFSDPQETTPENKETVVELKETLVDMKENLVEMKENMVEMKENIVELKENVVELERADETTTFLPQNR